MLAHMHPSRLRFTCRTRPITEGSSHLWLTHPGSARCPEPLCPLRVLPLRGSVYRHLERHYPLIIAHTGSCARPKPSRCFQCIQRVFAGCRQSLLGVGPSRCYLRKSFPRCLDPYPGGILWCICPFLPIEHRPSPDYKKVGSHTYPHSDFSTELLTRLQSFRYVQAPRFAHHPGRSYRSSTPVELGSRDFYFRAPHGSLPPRVPDILAVRIGQLTTGDLTSTTCSRCLTP